MKKKSLSTLGYIMEALNIPTVSMSRSIHVDASLISKWKTGDRNISPKSIYFEDVIDFIMQESTNTIHQNLKNILINLYPHEKIEDEKQIENLLRQALSNSKNIDSTTKLASNKNNIISAITFQDNHGRREAISKLLDYAESMTVPGEILFVEHEEFYWLLEDENYAKAFVNRIENLIHKGFHAVFVIHYSVYKDQLVKLFDICSPLIFHRNIDWYYYEYYDETSINFSFFILNNALSLLGFSANSLTSSTIAFTNTDIVIQHELMARHLIDYCQPFFSNFKLNDVTELITDISQFRKMGPLYSYLPAPVFLISEESTLCEILKNQVDYKVIEKCLNLNKLLKKVIYPNDSTKKETFIYIFQYEELLHRASQYTFVSTSLSIACEKTILITAQQYANKLRYLAKILLEYDNIIIVLVSKKDQVSLPNINCWCKKDIWMAQMNTNGLRLSSEFTIVNAASTKWERCIRAIPSQRKEKQPVSQFLLELADRCENIKP